MPERSEAAALHSEGLPERGEGLSKSLSGAIAPEGSSARRNELNMRSYCRVSEGRRSLRRFKVIQGH